MMMKETLLSEIPSISMDISYSIELSVETKISPRMRPEVTQHLMTSSLLATADVPPKNGAVRRKSDKLLIQLETLQ